MSWKYMSWKYTRGPWEIGEISPGAGAVWAGSLKLCDLDNIADAWLIAAAPEMFELLESIENDTGKMPEWLCNRIQEVCKKVRGE